MTERELQGTILHAAALFGWIVQHNADSRRAHPGWPDLVLGHPERKEVVVWELKQEYIKWSLILENRERASNERTRNVVRASVRRRI